MCVGSLEELILDVEGEGEIRTCAEERKVNCGINKDKMRERKREAGISSIKQEIQISLHASLDPGMKRKGSELCFSTQLTAVLATFP